MTAAERQKRVRDRRKAENMVQVRAWVPAHAKPAVMAAIDKAVKDTAERDDEVKG